MPKWATMQSAHTGKPRRGQRTNDQITVCRSFAEAIGRAMEREKNYGRSVSNLALAHKLGVSNVSVARYLREEFRPTGSAEIVVRDALKRHWNIIVEEQK